MRIEEELMGDERPGIGSILGFSRQGTERRGSLRRTFSADMSSKKCSVQNVPLSLRKNASTKEFSTMPASDTSSSWSSDEAENEVQRKEVEKPNQFDIWSSIQSQTTANSSSLLNTPYVHPLMRRSSSSLSEKSLFICTESLGSETGSDGFSSWDDQGYLSSSSSDQSSDDEEEDEPVQDQIEDRKKELVAVNYNCCVSRKSPTCFFPPPLPSISRRDGPCIRMRPRRTDGRLIVDAIPAPSNNYLHAHRQDGRLRLSFINLPASKEADIQSQEEQPKTEYEEQEQEQEQEDSSEEVKAKEREVVLEVRVKQEDVPRVHQPILVMNSKFMAGLRPIRQNNQNPWVEKKIDGWGEAKIATNGCDRSWKSGPLVHLPNASSPKKLMLSKKPIVFKGEDFLPMMRCKEFGRPVLVWEPFCIVTT